MVEDKELEKIKSKKLKEMLGRGASEKKESFLQERGQPVFSKPVKVTDGTFMEVVWTNPLVVVDCWAPWCDPCYMVSTIIEELTHDYAGKTLFGKLKNGKLGKLVETRSTTYEANKAIITFRPENR